MSATSSIEWTDRTWNPVRGCSIVSPGCVHCYAMKQAHRFSGGPKVDGGQVVIREAGPYHGLTKLTKAGPQWTGVVRTVEDALLEPLSWRKPQRVFVNSMSDLFHEDVPDEFIDKVFAVMALTPRHTFQILTKRAERMRRYFDTRVTRHIIAAAAADLTGKRDGFNGKCDHDVCNGPWPLPNVWLGVSVENQDQADKRIPLLLQTPAAVRWISAEPLLGPLNLKPEWLGNVECCIACDSPKFPVRQMAGVETRQGWSGCVNESCPAYGEQSASGSSRRMLDWVVPGGESGPGARPFDVTWADSIIRQCKAAGVACFMKQLGSNPRERIGDPGELNIHLRDRKGGDWAEWPELFRVREYPKGASA